MYNFEVFTGASLRSYLKSVKVGKAKTGYEVVMNHMAGLHGHNYMVFINKLFTSVKLLVDIVNLGSYGTCTVRSNRYVDMHAYKQFKESGQDLLSSHGYHVLTFPP